MKGTYPPDSLSTYLVLYYGKGEHMKNSDKWPKNRKSKSFNLEIKADYSLKAYIFVAFQSKLKFSILSKAMER